MMPQRSSAQSCNVLTHINPDSRHARTRRQKENTMFTFFDRPSREHFIDNGKVGCPVRGRDVETDVCAGCRSLEAIEADGERPYVRCEPAALPAWVLRRRA